jgi:sterol desaturase/sphingolipid hydroxylase (fatty acid hydroxylase superfamily)
MYDYFWEIINHLAALLLAPNSVFSIGSLFCAFVVASGFLIWKRHQRGKEVKFGVLLRALFRKQQLMSASHRVDIAFAILNTTVLATVIGVAIFSFNAVSSVVIDGLVAAFGPSTPTSLPGFAASLLLTVGLFLAVEFAYWFDHYLSHRIPFLWEFHRVHHEAEVLTPVTAFRVHPVDTIVYFNIKAICLGLTNGGLSYALGANVHQFVIWDANVFMVLAIHLVVHLQHSHVWIPFTGLLGRIMMSPAHHQIHHSMNPKHFNRNLGGVLAIFDWAFGTLHIPSKTPEKLTFGVAADAEHPAMPHTLTGSLIQPMVCATKQIAQAVVGTQGSHPLGLSQSVQRSLSSR